MKKITNYLVHRQIFVLFLIFVFVISTNAIASGTYNLSTPSASLKFFADNMMTENYKPEKAAVVLNTEETNAFKLKTLAIKLKKIFDAKSIIINAEKISQNPDYSDSVSGRNIYIINSKVPEIYLEKVDDQWLISKETVNNISMLYSKLYPIETSRFIESLPDWAHDSFLDIEAWQYLGFVIFLFGSLLIYKLFSWIFGYFIVRIIAIFNYKHLADRYIKPVARPLSLLFVVVLFWIFLPLLEFPGNLMLIFSYIYGLLVPLLFIIVGYRFINLITDIMSIFVSKTSTRLDENLFPLARKILKIVIIIFGIMYLLQNIGLNITPIVAGVSIGGLAFALAAQETIKNLFGSITLFADKPFDVGDWIIFDKIEGTVEEIGIRSTRIRTFSKSLISIPNGKLADMVIDNMGKRNQRRFSSKLSVPYTTAPETIEKFIESIKKFIIAHEFVSKDFIEVRLFDMGESSLQILIYCFLNLDDWDSELTAREEIISEIIKIAHKLEIELPSPKPVKIIGPSTSSF
jgi:MscS family membrane protein